MIRKIELFDCALGAGNIQLIRVEADRGVGWAEYSEEYPNSGVSAAIRSFVPHLVGRDSFRTGSIVATLRAMRSEAQYGVSSQAVSAIENALLDLKARHYGVPVMDLFGGPVRDGIPIYWSHCGLFRLPFSRQDDRLPLVETLDGLAEVGAEAVRRGLRALKVSVVTFDADGQLLPVPRKYWRDPASASLTADLDYIAQAKRIVAAFREKIGPDVLLMLDVNFNLSGDGNLRLVRALEEFNLAWLELDSHDPGALRDLRSFGRVPIASGEALYGLTDYRRHLEQRAMDVCIIDVAWNGFSESTKIAALAQSYEVNVAPHNFTGHLSTMMSAQFCAVVPNLSIMEFNVEGLKGRDELVLQQPVIESGALQVSDRPGWGIDVNEEAVRDYAKH